MGAELVHQAAEILTPLLAGGAGAMVAGAGKDTGSDVYRAAKNLLGRIGHLIKRDATTEEAVTSALSAALDTSVVTTAELEELVLLAQANPAPAIGNVQVGDVKAQTSFVGNTNFHGDATFSGPTNA